MADENTATTQGTTGTTDPQTGGATQTAPAEPSGGTERTFSQAEVDAIVGDRLRRERDKVRSKYAGYDELKAQAEAHADYDDVAKARDEAIAERDALSAQIARRELLDKVSAATGVPSDLLHGETEEELTASANGITAYVKAQAPEPKYPSDKGGGQNPSPLTKEQIEAIPDALERIRMRSQHLDLYK